tara:strand:+ start:820 stop:1365 length:546 start_codon:yes stop_codon:yes gene_type:complete
MLLRAKVSKGTYTFKLQNCVRKVFYRIGERDDGLKIIEKYTGNVLQYVDVMDKVFPGYLIRHGNFSKNAYFFDYKILPGKCLKDIRQNFGPSGLRFTEDFMKKFRSFCIDSIKETSPYSHGDWTPDNVLEYKGEWFLIDWDCVGLRSITETQRRLNECLKETFGYNIDIVTKRELSFMENY